jgi:hypothetical protein
VAQIENVALIIYNVNTERGEYITNDLEFTHAWLPKDKFGKVVEDEDSNWIFTRKGDSFLAFWTQKHYTWQGNPGEDRDREIIVSGTQNVYICELGSKRENGTFNAFQKKILAAPLLADGTDVVYYSPSQGILEFGWTGKLRQNGRHITLGDHARYDNPYAQVPYDASQMRIEANDHWLALDWDNSVRTASEFMQP